MQSHRFNGTPRRSGSGPDPCLADYSSSEQALLHRARELGFGWLKDIPVTSGVPEIARARVIRVHRLGKPHAERERGPDRGAKLKCQESELVAIVRRIQRGTIRQIIVQHGLPMQVDVEEHGDGTA